MKDISETKRYELMNKIFALENELLSAQITAEEWKDKHDQINTDKEDLEERRDDLQAEYITMKTNHHAVVGKVCFGLQTFYFRNFYFVKISKL